MTKAQNTFYWSLWGKLRKLDPQADRKAIHAQLGLPESHTVWGNAHFDKWKGYCLAQTQPGNYRAQVEQETMPAIRKQVFIRHILKALQEPEEYAEHIIARMQRNRKLSSTGAGRMVTLDSLGEKDLKNVMIALKKECRRRWRTKAELVGEVWTVRCEIQLDDDTAWAAIMKALCVTELHTDLSRLYYEPLLIVLSVCRDLVAGIVPNDLPPIPEASAVDPDNVPF